MKQEQVYTCEYCGQRYTTKEDAEECERKCKASRQYIDISLHVPVQIEEDWIHDHELYFTTDYANYFFDVPSSAIEVDPEICTISFTKGVPSTISEADTEKVKIELIDYAVKWFENRLSAVKNLYGKYPGLNNAAEKEQTRS